MERSRAKQVAELKNIHDNKISSMKHQLREKDREIEDKNRQLNELKQKYENLVTRFEEVFSQRAAQKNLDIKVPGWLPETLSTKDLFDVFLKNKVLQYCSWWIGVSWLWWNDMSYLSYNFNVLSFLKELKVERKPDFVFWIQKKQAKEKLKKIK